MGSTKKMKLITIIFIILICIFNIRIISAEKIEKKEDIETVLLNVTLKLSEEVRIKKLTEKIDEIIKREAEELPLEIKNKILKEERYNKTFNAIKEILKKEEITSLDKARVKLTKIFIKKEIEQILKEKPTGITDEQIEEIAKKLAEKVINAKQINQFEEKIVEAINREIIKLIKDEKIAILYEERQLKFKKCLNSNITIDELIKHHDYYTVQVNEEQSGMHVAEVLPTKELINYLICIAETKQDAKILNKIKSMNEDLYYETNWYYSLWKEIFSQIKLKKPLTDEKMNRYCEANVNPQDRGSCVAALNSYQNALINNNPIECEIERKLPNLDKYISLCSSLVNYDKGNICEGIQDEYKESCKQEINSIIAYLTDDYSIIEGIKVENIKLRMYTMLSKIYFKKFPQCEEYLKDVVIHSYCRNLYDYKGEEIRLLTFEEAEKVQKQIEEIEKKREEEMKKMIEKTGGESNEK